MAYLGKYIRQILSRQETVTLPGFGSLKIVQGSGTKGEDGKIDPPGALIKFDAEHPRDDGKLAEEYANGEGLQDDEARQQVLELVDAIKFKLDKGESYELEIVGTFSRDDDNRVHFVKDSNWVIDPELFGLTSLDLLELDNEDLNDTSEPIPEFEEDIKQAASPGKKPVSVERKTPKRIQRKPVNKWRIIWIVVGSLIAVLVVILLLPSGDGVEFGKDGIVFRNNETQVETPAVRQEPVQADQEEQPEDRELDPVLEEDTEPLPVQENHYFIIAGSFQNIQNASELMEELKARGFRSEIISTENRLFRVSVEAYPTKEEAVKELARIKLSPGLESAWLMTR